MAFGMFEIHAGDFKACKDNQYLPGPPGKPGTMLLKSPGKFLREKVGTDQIAELDVASEESVKRLGGTVGWGIAGGVLLGPVGLLAGLIAGGRGKDVTFVCKLKDGRKFMATAHSDVYTKITAALF